jgi:hypothetical protein
MYMIDSIRHIYPYVLTELIKKLESDYSNMAASY